MPDYNLNLWQFPTAPKPNCEDQERIVASCGALSDKFVAQEHQSKMNLDIQPELEPASPSGKPMTRLRILVLGADCDPERVSISYVTYCHAAALAQLHDVTLVLRAPHEASVRRANAPFRALEVIRMPWLERIYAWSLRRIFKSNFTSQALTAFGYPFSLAFE